VDPLRLARAYLFADDQRQVSLLNHPAKCVYNAIQIFKMKSPVSSIISD